MSVEVRNTRKSRLIADMSDAVVELVLNGNHHPSKKDIVSQVVASSLSESASPAMQTLLEDETANMLERYFSDVCKAASEYMDGAPYHLVSRKFYRAKCRKPDSYEEAAMFVVCFGNGRRGKAEGVRFPCEDDEPDALLLYVAEKTIDVVEAAIKTNRDRIDSYVNSPALGAENRANLTESARQKAIGHG